MTRKSQWLSREVFGTAVERPAEASTSLILLCRLPLVVVAPPAGGGASDTAHCCWWWLPLLVVAPPAGGGSPCWWRSL